VAKDDPAPVAAQTTVPPGAVEAPIPEEGPGTSAVDLSDEESANEDNEDQGPQPDGAIFPPPAKSLPDVEMSLLKQEYQEIAAQKYASHVKALDEYVTNQADIFKNTIITNRSSKMDQVTVVRKYNFPLSPEWTDEEIKANILRFYTDKVGPHSAYRQKLDVRLGAILETYDEDGEVEKGLYFYPSRNTTLIPTGNEDSDGGLDRGETGYISCGQIGEGEEALREILPHVDLEKATNKNRPDTKTALLFLSNVEFAVFRCGNSFVGADEDCDLSVPIVAPLPKAIKHSRLILDPKSSKGKNDCFWRALAYSMGKIKNLRYGEREAEKLATEFVEWRKENLKAKKPTVEKLLKGGLDILSKEKFSDQENHQKFTCDVSSIISQIENCFNVNLYLLSYDRKTLESLEEKMIKETQTLPTPNQIRSQCCLQPFHVSCGKHGRKKLHLLLDGCKRGKLHCYIIKKIDDFSQNYRCKTCNRYFTKWGNCKRHQKAGACLSRFVYPGGPFQRQRIVWEKLAEEGIDFSMVLEDGEKYPRMQNRITWDIESRTVPLTDGVKNTEKVQYINKHVALSISVATNVTGMEGVEFFFDNEDPKNLFCEAYDHMVSIQETSELDWHARMGPVYAQIEQKIIMAGGLVKVPEDRYDTFPAKVQKRLKWLALKTRKEKDVNIKSVMPPCVHGYKPLPDGARKKCSVKGRVNVRSFKRTGGLITSEQDVDSLKNGIEPILGPVLIARGVLGQNKNNSAGEYTTPEGKRRGVYIRRMKALLNQLKKYGSTLPVFGYNSSRYDLGVLAEYFPVKMGLTKGTDCLSRGTEAANGIPLKFWSKKKQRMIRSKKYKVFLLMRDIATFRPNVIGQTNNYKAITTLHGLKFLDLINYVPAKTSLDSLVKNYEKAGVSDRKGYFPYSVLSEPDFHEQKLLDRYDRIIDPPGLYSKFDDKLKVPVHRKGGNHLEQEWAQFTRGYQLQKVQSVIWDLAQHFTEQETGETDEQAESFDKDYREGLKRGWMDFLGYHSVEFQKQVTVDDTFVTGSHVNVPTGPENFQAGVVNVIKQEKFGKYLDYLCWYNNKDVEIMMPVIDKMTENFQSMNPMIEIGVENVSLPNIARILAHKSAEENNGVFYIAKGDVEGNVLERTMRRNLYGGPSIIFNRYAEAYKTQTKGGNTVKKVVTEDANGLYSRCMQKHMPVGPSVHCYGPDETNLDSPVYSMDTADWVYKEIGKSQDSLGQHSWLSLVQSELKDVAEAEQKLYTEADNGAKYPPVDFVSTIHTKRTLGHEIRVGPYSADGIRHRSQFTDYERRHYPKWARGVVYEFNGDWYHGKPSMIKAKHEKDQKHLVELLVDRLQKTMEKMKYLLRMKYVVFMSWEGDFKDIYKQYAYKGMGESLPKFTRSYLLGYRKDVSMKEARRQKLQKLKNPEKFQELLMMDYDEDYVYNDTDPPIGLFGMAEVDLEPEGGRSFDDFGPIFAAGVREGEKVGSLRGVKRVQKCVLTTPHLQCLCSVGIKIIKVWKVWEFNSAPCFREFVDKAVQERKKGDLPDGNPLQADLYKLVVNAAYGGLIQNKDKHAELSFFTNQWDVCTEVNKPAFKDAVSWTDDLIEVALTKEKVRQDVPVQLGKFILDYAKMHMVNFYFHVIKSHCDMDKIDLISMDTDSFTMAISADDLDDCVLPYAREKWEKQIRPYWFVHRGCRKQCPTPDQCNKRLPGPFKNENKGDKTIGLSSKLFTVTSKTPGESVKIACKGLMKNRLYLDDSDRFKNTLEGAVGGFAMTWSTFTRQKHEMMTVTSERSVTNVYKKRQVDQDDPTRTHTLSDVFDCSTPLKKRKLWWERRAILAAKRGKTNHSADQDDNNTDHDDNDPDNDHDAVNPGPPPQQILDPIAEQIARNRERAMWLKKQRLLEKQAEEAATRAALIKSNTMELEIDMFGDIIPGAVERNKAKRAKMAYML